MQAPMLVSTTSPPKLDQRPPKGTLSHYGGRRRFAFSFAMSKRPVADPEGPVLELLRVLARENTCGGVLKFLWDSDTTVNTTVGSIRPPTIAVLTHFRRVCKGCGDNNIRNTVPRLGVRPTWLYFFSEECPLKWLVDICPHLSDVHRRVPFGQNSRMGAMGAMGALGFWGGTKSLKHTCPSWLVRWGLFHLRAVYFSKRPPMVSRLRSPR